MLVWLDASVGVADGVLRAADAQRFGDIEAWRQGLLAQRDTHTIIVSPAARFSRVRTPFISRNGSSDSVKSYR